MKFAYLGSGSRGNAALIESADATVLLDCGFAARELFRRCAARNVSPREIDAVVVTHEHSDHVKATGLAALCAQSGAAVFATLGTARALGWAGDGDGPGWRRIFPGRGFSVGGLRFSPAPILHDAAEPVQFVVENGGGRAGFLTDIGAESEPCAPSFRIWTRWLWNAISTKRGWRRIPAIRRMSSGAFAAIWGIFRTRRRLLCCRGLRGAD